MRHELYRKRKEQRLTQEQLALMVGIDRTAYCRIEKSGRRPHVDVAIRIAEVLGVKVEDIFLPNDVQTIHKDMEQVATLDQTGTE